MKDKVLFVTKGGEGCCEGFTYVVDLAKTLNAGIEVLLLMPEPLKRSFDDIMVMAAYAEAGDFISVKSQMNEEQERLRAESDARVKPFIEKARELAGDFPYEISFEDISSAIRNYLKSRPYIDMVLLSPSLAGNKKGIDLKKLIRSVSKPIVNISKPLGAEI